jgi:molybdopterin molybdotransferase
LRKGQAARIMTGAPVPEGTTAIVPVEDTDALWVTSIDLVLPCPVGVMRAVPFGSYIRSVGEDIRAGDLVLEAGTIIRPQELGVLAALGHAMVLVVKRPRVAVLSNGNELVRVEQELTPGKIRDVNSYTLAGLIEQHGGEPMILPIADDSADGVRQLFEVALKTQPTMIISSAGVSVGAADLIRNVLEELGDVAFWRINLRPGKPLAFGYLQDVPFFGLPGNPVSVMVTFDVLVRPALLKLAGRPDNRPLVNAVAGEELSSDGRRSYLRVRLNYEGDQLVATTTGTQSSGALMSMVLADGLMIVPEGVTQIRQGEAYQVRLLRPLADRTIPM